MIPEEGAAAAAASVREVKCGEQVLLPQSGDKLRDILPFTSE